MKEFFKQIMSLFPKKEDALDAMLREQGKDPEEVLSQHRRMREAEKVEAIKNDADDE